MMYESEFNSLAKQYRDGSLTFQRMLDTLSRNDFFYILFNLDKRRKGYEIFKIYSETTENLKEIFELLKTSKHKSRLYDLNYFCYAYDLIEKFLDQNICSLKDIIDIFQEYGCLYFLIENDKLWSLLERTGRLTDDDLQYAFDRLNTYRDLSALFRSDKLMMMLFNYNILTSSTLSHFIEKIDDRSLLSEILTNAPFRKNLHILIDDDENLRLYIEKLFFPSTVYKSDSDLRVLLEMTAINSEDVYVSAVKKGFISDHEFLKFLERAGNSSTLASVVSHDTKFLKILIQNSAISSSSLKKYFKTLSPMSMLVKLFSSSLQILKEYFVKNNQCFDVETIQKLNLVVEEGQNSARSVRYPQYVAQDFFGFVERAQTELEKTKSRFTKDDKMLFERIHRNKEMYELGILNFNHFSTEQLYEVYDCIQNSEKAKNMLKQLIENNLESQYDFDQLKELLTKDDRKKRQKLNF